MKKVLAISIDENLLSGKSTDTLERQTDYANGLDQLTVIVLTRKKYNSYKQKNLSIISTNSGSIAKSFFDAWRIIKNLRKKCTFDVVTTQDPFFLGLIGLYASKLFKAKFKPQLHIEAFSNKYWERESISNYIQSIVGFWVIKHSDLIRVVSKRSEVLMKKLKIKSEFIPVSTSLDKFNLTHFNEEIDVLCVSRLVKQKNLFFLVDVLSKIFIDFPNLKAVIVGDGPLYKKLHKYIRKKRLDKNIKLAGNISHDKIKEYYQKSKMFVLPSLYEGWGLVCIEASMAGLPVIMSNTGCAGEIIINNKSGTVCEINDADAFVSAIKKYINDAQLRKKHASEAKKLCIEKLNTKKLRKQLIDFLNE